MSGSIHEETRVSLRILLAMAPVLFLLASCGGQDDGQAAPSSTASSVATKTPPPGSGDLELRLRTGKARYARGEQVDFELTLTNGGGAPARAEFPSGQRFDIVVAGPGGDLWQWSAGMFFTQALGELVLQPGESRQFEATWDQRDADGTAVGPGSYRAEAWLATAASAPRGTATFEIAP